MSNLAKYFAIAKVEFKNKRWAIVDFYLSFFSTFFQITIFYFIFNYIVINEYNNINLFLYFSIVNIIYSSLNPAQYIAYFHMEDINSGNLSIKTIKPISYSAEMYIKTLSSFVFNICINCILILIILFIINRKVQPYIFLISLFSVFISFNILYLVQAIIGCLAIWVHDITRLRDVIFTIMLLFGGKLIPSDLLYGTIKKIAFYTPFPYIYDVPTKIFQNKFSYNDLKIQIFWVILLGLIYRLIYKRFVLKNLEYGG